MRPVSIRFQGFGPYVTEQFIDFAPLAARGIFLICGETGAGKTTILDAICYALYGRSSGGARGELDAMRCEFCRPEDSDCCRIHLRPRGEEIPLHTRNSSGQAREYRRAARLRRFHRRSLRAAHREPEEDHRLEESRRNTRAQLRAVPAGRDTSAGAVRETARLGLGGEGKDSIDPVRNRKMGHTPPTR